MLVTAYTLPGSSGLIPAAGTQGAPKIFLQLTQQQVTKGIQWALVGTGAASFIGLCQ